MAKQKEVGRVVRVYRIIAMYIKYHGVYCATVSIRKTRVGYLWLTREESPPSPFLLPDSEESLQSDFQPKLLLVDDDEEEHTWSWCEWTILVTKCIFFLVKPWQRRKQMRQQRKQWQRPTSCWFPSERRKALFFFFLKIFDLEDIYPAKVGAWVCDDNCGIFLRHPSCDVKCWTNLVLQHKILYVDMYVYRIHWYFVLAVLLLFLRHNNCKYMWWHQNSNADTKMIHWQGRVDNWNKNQNY